MRRLLMTGGSLLAAVLMFAWSQVDSLPMFYVIWLGLGACQSVTLYEPAFAVITRVYGPRFRQAIMVMTFVGGLASTFGIPFAQLLIERIDWRPTLVVLAVINLGVAVLIHCAVRARARRRRRSRSASPGRALPARARSPRRCGCRPSGAWSWPSRATGSPSRR